MKKILLLLLTLSCLVITVMGATKTKQTILLKIEEEDLPAITNVSLTMYSDKKLEHVAELQNVYKRDVLSSEVVGIVGAPIEVSSQVELDHATLTFTYDKNKLKEVDEKNLVIMWCDEEAQFYQVITEQVNVNPRQHTITCDITQPGTYLVEDVETWIAVWTGAYEGCEAFIEEEEVIKGNWLEDFDANDLAEIADVSWYDDEKNEFHISTANELAGLASLVNSGNNFFGCTIILDNDIDLKGYKWAPIGWYKYNDGSRGCDYPFSGAFNGNYHKIKNMSIHSTKKDVGLFGRTMIGFSVRNLGLENCDIQGGYIVGGIVGDNITSDKLEDYSMENCYVTGSIKGELEVGALVASTAKMKINNCYSTATIEATEKRVGGLVGNLRGGSIENSYYAGKIVMKEKKENKYYVEYSGAIVGEGGLESPDPQYQSTIKNCFYNIGLNPNLRLYGGGNFTEQTINQKEKAGKVASYMMSDELVNKLGDASIWIRNDKINHGMPYLKNFKKM